MAVVSMKQFLEAGVHFGHQTKRWNPKMSPYIFGAKQGVHIIDLQKTLRCLKEAYDYARDLAARGETVLFVGTKPQSKEIIREEAERCGGFYINERWLGGLLTNFNTIRQSVAQLKKYEEMRGADGLYSGILKKEALRIEKRRLKLERSLGGIKEMRKFPGAVYVVDCKKERISLKEAQKLSIPIIAVVDTNCDPDGIDYVIPGNDDAIRAIRLFTATIANALLEGRGLWEAKQRSVEPEPVKPQRQQASRRAAAAASAAERPPQPVSPPVAAEPAPPKPQEPAAVAGPGETKSAEPAPESPPAPEPATE